jgi:hypothetical protein
VCRVTQTEARYRSLSLVWGHFFAVIWPVEIFDVTSARHGADIRILFATKQLNTSPRSGIALRQNRNASLMQAARSSGVSAITLELELRAITIVPIERSLMVSLLSWDRRTATVRPNTGIGVG